MSQNSSQIARGSTPRPELAQNVFQLPFRFYSLITIGSLNPKNSANHLRLEDHRVSYLHATIDHHEGQYFVQDRNLEYGTTVNGIILGKERVQIFDGDNLGIGINKRHGALGFFKSIPGIGREHCDGIECILFRYAFYFHVSIIEGGFALIRSEPPQRAKSKVCVLCDDTLPGGVGS